MGKVCEGSESIAPPRQSNPCNKIVDGNISRSLTRPSYNISKMKCVTQLPLSNGTKAIWRCPEHRIAWPLTPRCLHTSTPHPATVAPITAPGPPPTAPLPSAEHVDSRVARRRKQAELLKRGQDLRSVAGGTGGGSAKTKRFWKDVHVQHADGMGPAIPTHLSILEHLGNDNA